MIADPHSQKDRWKEHFIELLNPPLSNVNLTNIDGLPTQPSFDFLSCCDEPPTRDENTYPLNKIWISIKAQE